MAGGVLLLALVAMTGGCELITGSDNTAPSAEITAPPPGATVLEGVEVTLQGSAADAEDGELAGSSLQWLSSRDGALGTGARVARADLSVGLHEIRLVATDGEGAADTARRALTVEENQPPEVSIAGPVDGSVHASGSEVTFLGAATDPEHGELEGGSLVWRSDLDGRLGRGRSVTRSDLRLGSHVVTLEAMDGQGNVGAASVGIDVVEGQPPSVEIERPSEGDVYEVGAAVTFRGSGSDPTEGRLSGSSLTWRSDREGEIGTGESFSRSDLTAGGHVITLTGTDFDGLSASETVNIRVEAPPSVVMDSPADQTVFDEGEVVTFEGSADDVEDGELTGSSLVWRSDVDGQLGTGETLTRSDLSPGPHLVSLTARDSDGNTATASADVLVEAPGYDLRVRFLSDVSSSQESTIREALERWEAVITGDLSPAFPSRGGACAESGVGIDDLLVSIRVTSIDGSGGVLARAGPCLLRSTDDLPMAGVMEIDEADLDAMESGGTLDDLVLHEAGHILGIGIGLVDGWSDRLRDLSTLDPYFAGSSAIAEFEAMEGHAYLSDPVPLANQGGRGTRSAHWREANFDDELMTGFLNPGTNPLSAVTIGALEDMGYVVDRSEADGYGLPMPQLALWEVEADATLARPDGSGTNFGSPGDGTLGSHLVAGTNEGDWDASHGNDELYTGILRLGVPGLPSGVSIEGVELELHQSDSHGSGSIEVLEVTGAWSEGSVTWDGRPGLGSSLLSYGNGDCSDCFLSSAALLSVVREWADGTSPNNGLALEAPDAGTGSLYSVGYGTRHDSQEGRRPRMRVEASTSGSGAAARALMSAAPASLLSLGDDVLDDIPLWSQTPDGRLIRLR
jgi:hypothetical protein